MEKRIEITGITSEDFTQIFQNSTFPAVGAEVYVQEGVKLVNLTSPSPNLIDTNMFTMWVASAAELADDVFRGLLVCYLYDALKGRRNVKITSELSTKIKIEVQECDDE